MKSKEEILKEHCNVGFQKGTGIPFVSSSLESVIKAMEAYKNQFPSPQGVTEITDGDLDYITEKIDEFLRNFPEYRCLDVIGKYKEWMRDRIFKAK